MEFALTKQSIKTCETLLDTVSEQIVDLDLVLPDYCPDIEKILKCTLTAQIYNRNLSGGQLLVEGSAKVSVLYCDSIKKNIRCCEQSVPFSASYSVKDSNEQYIIVNDVKTEYVNCRALSPRKLIIHGAFSLYSKVYSKGVCELYSYENDDDLQVKTQKVNTAVVTGFCQELFSVTEDIQIVNKPAVEAILSSKLLATLTEVKVVPNKLMIKGELSLKLLYLSDLEQGSVQQLTYLIPFSQIIDCEGVDENTINNVSVNILSYEIRVKAEALSENPVVTLDCKLCFTEIGYEIKESTVINDAYSVKNATEIDFDTVTAINDLSVISDSFMHKSSISLDDIAISKLVDIYSEQCSVTPVVADSSVKLNGKLNLCIIAFDNENNPVYIERASGFEHDISVSSSFNTIMQIKSTPVSMSYRLTQDNTIEIRSEIKTNAVVADKNPLKTVCCVVADEEKPIQCDDCALTLYYAQQGESFWDIAKKYSTYYEALLEENESEQELLDEAKMLLIPIA